MAKPAPPRDYPGTYDTATIPEGATLRDPLGHTYQRRGDDARWHDGHEHHHKPLAALWLPLEVIGQ